MELIWIHLRTRFLTFIEWLYTLCKFYYHLNYSKADLYLLTSYFLNSPYTISKNQAIEEGAEEIYTYGETPIPTLELITKKCSITQIDHLFEVGSGRGRSAIWWHYIIGCEVTGIDSNPIFIQRAIKLENQRLHFRKEDFFSTDYSGATVIYLYGTMLTEEQIKKLAQTFANLPNETKILTVSYPLNDYCPTISFQIIDSFEATFHWGKTEIYLQVPLGEKSVKSTQF